MIVVDCPARTRHGDAPTQEAFYNRIRDWKLGGGPRNLLGYLLTYDLKGWTPPAMPPLTAEKYMARRESLTTVQQLAEDMQTADEHTLKLWLDAAMANADEMEVSQNPRAAMTGRAIKNNLPNYQIRPFYTPEELSLVFPMVVEQLMGVKWKRTTPAGELSRELRNAGIRYLHPKDDPRGFKHNGIVRQYLIIHSPNDWESPLSQADFDRLMRAWPTYKQVRGRK
jgi:hypothetical protein